MNQNNINNERPYGLWAIGGLNLLGLFLAFIEYRENMGVFLWTLYAVAIFLIYGLVILKANWARIVFLVFGSLAIIQLSLSLLILLSNIIEFSLNYFLIINITSLIIPLVIQIWVIKYLTRNDVVQMFGLIPKGRKYDKEAICPFCKKPLRTKLAKQCPHCFEDWHDKPEIKAVIQNSNKV